MPLTKEMAIFEDDSTGEVSHSEHITDNPYRHARNMTGWRREIIQVSPGAFLGRVLETSVSGSFFSHEYLSRGVFHIGPAYAGGLTLGLVHSPVGSYPIWNGVQVQPDTVLCVPPGVEMALRTYENTRIIWLVVPTTILGAKMLPDFLSGDGSIAEPMCLDDVALAERIVSAHQALRTIAVHPQSRHAGSLSRPGWVFSEIVDIVRCFVAAYTKWRPQLGIREAHAMRILRQVRHCFSRRIGERITLQDLSEATAASERTVRNACEMITGESPMSFLKAIRLNQVRRALLNASTPVKVTEIGTRLGFLHLPQFSHDYRALFAELPSETIGRQLGNRERDTLA